MGVIRCGHCRGEIAAKYIEFQEASYHESCYEDYVAPRCAHCRQVVNGAYISFSESSKIYHENCYDSFIISRCDICGKGMEGAYRFDYWGNKFHPYHASEFPRCLYCDRLCCDALTGGRVVKYLDGRSVCHMCFRSAVSTREKVRLAEARAREVLSLFDFHIEIPVDIDLLSKNEMFQIANDKCLGRCVITRTALRKPQFQISILSGLPKLRFMNVLAHELAHVWIDLNCSRKPPLLLEEGTANLLSYLVMLGNNSEEANYLKDEMLRDQDSVYGDGFKKSRSQFESLGLKQYLELLKAGNFNTLLCG